MQNNENLINIMRNEKILAFFDFCKLDKDGNSTIEGLCKLSAPIDKSVADYINLTFIFDTPNEEKLHLAKHIAEKLTPSAIRKEILSARATNSIENKIPLQEHFIYQLDILFDSNQNAERVEQIASVVRKITGLDAETPQMWDEDSLLPERSELEKQSLSARAQALADLKNKSSASKKLDATQKN